MNCCDTFMRCSDSASWGGSPPIWQVAMSCFPGQGSAKLRPPPKASLQRWLSSVPTHLVLRPRGFCFKLSVGLLLSELRPPALGTLGLRPSELSRYSSLAGSGASIHLLYPTNPPERARSSSPRLFRSGSLTSAHSLQPACSRCRFVFFFFLLVRGR